MEGDTHVNIATLTNVTYVSKTEEVDETDGDGNTVYEDDGVTPKKKTQQVSRPSLGVDILKNVYGGGNAVEVTGDSYVIIGKERVVTP